MSGSREWIAHRGSMSKVLSPGQRVGWIIAPPELLAKATMCKQYSDAHTSTFARSTAAIPQKRPHAGHADAPAQRHAERAKAMVDALEKELGDAIEFTRPNGGLFFWARLTGAGGKVKDAGGWQKGRSRRAWRLCRLRPFA
jgi:DNA-binding transcriptional MocR family regulator